MKLFLKFTDPAVVFEEVQALKDADQESLWVLGVDAKNKVRCKTMIHLGGLDNCSVDPKIVFKRLIVSSSTSFILVHNHPSGNPEPSHDDIRLTTALKEGSKILDIKFLDHVIVGETYFSFRERNLI
jgi:DNA repair protein RadC